jgi:hypothetical protein
MNWFVIMEIKLRRMRFVGHVACMGEMRMHAELLG